jgi:hypothetical protein
MHEKPIRLAMWTLAILICVVFYVGGALMPRPTGGPWLALSGILFVLAAIALGARRHLPFGGRV